MQRSTFEKSGLLTESETEDGHDDDFDCEEVSKFRDVYPKEWKLDNVEDTEKIKPKG